MSTVKEIEGAIRQLSGKDLSELRAWFSEFNAAAWDQQIDEDARSGRLDAFYEKLQQENAGEPDLPLDDLLHEEKLS